MQSVEQILERLEPACVHGGIGARVISSEGKLMGGRGAQGLCGCCAACGACRDAVYAGKLSAQMGIAYIHRCQLGAVLVAATLVNDDRVFGHVVLGPVRMWDWDEYAQGELRDSCRAHPELLRGVDEAMVWREFERMTQWDSERARAMSQLLFDICAAISCEDSYLTRQRDSYNLQTEMFGVVESDKDRLRGDEGAYPINIEQELLRRVRVGDRHGAKEILNQLMGHIFYGTGGNTEVIKARSLELVVMISRAAVEGGAALDRLLGMNYNFISELSKLKAFDDICLWLVKVLDQFMDTVYSTRDTPNMLLLRGAVGYISEHYAENIALDEVAASVHVSSYYLSHLFREELGITFIEYLTRTRVDKAKQLLMNTELSVGDVARGVGYDDAGYFSRVFKKMTGMTPAAYRKA